MKTEIGQNVWVLRFNPFECEYHIEVESVYALGTNEFVTRDYTYHMNAYMYFEHGSTWFTSLQDAKNHAEKIAKKNLEWSDYPSIDLSCSNKIDTEENDEPGE